MRILSFILAFGLVLAGAPLAGSTDANLPAPGAFAYNGVPLSPDVPMQLAADR